MTLKQRGIETTFFCLRAEAHCVLTSIFTAIKDGVTKLIIGGDRLYGFVYSLLGFSQRPVLTIITTPLGKYLRHLHSSV